MCYYKQNKDGEPHKDIADLEITIVRTKELNAFVSVHLRAVDTSKRST